jgi:fumarylacetoacetase
VLLPYGVDRDGHVVVDSGDGRAVDLAAAEGLDVGREVFASGSLDAFLALGPEAWALTRAQLEASLGRQPDSARRRYADLSLQLPWTVGDYSDFYASRQHVEAMGAALRPGDDPLPPAWRHLPQGYHGRAGTVIVSGEEVYRPWGVRPGSGGQPEYGPSGRLDVEMELGFVVGVGVARGRTVTAAEAERLVFGMVVVNDWSARDIQAFESRPLGPFLGKSFATSVSPWVVPMAALEPYRVEGPPQDPEPAGYLKVAEPRNLAVTLTLEVNGAVLSCSDASGLYWSPAQMLAHLTANGAGVRRGDLFATGTVSGPGPGSLMEAGPNPRFLADGDTVTVSAACAGGPLGAVSARVAAR